MPSYCRFRPIECLYSLSVSVSVPRDKIRGSAILRQADLQFSPFSRLRDWQSHCSLLNFGRSQQKQPAVRTTADWPRTRIRPSGWLLCICSAQLFSSGSAKIGETAIESSFYCCLPNCGRCGQSQDRVLVNCPLVERVYPVEWMAVTGCYRLLHAVSVTWCFRVLHAATVAECYRLLQALLDHPS